MPLESAADFSSYVETTTGHGVTGTFIEKQQNFFDDFPLIDPMSFIDDGNTSVINLIIDQEYFGIGGGTVDVDGFEPRAVVKATDVPFISQNDELRVDAITTDQGNTLVAATTFLVKTVEPDNTGLVSLVLQKQ